MQQLAPTRAYDLVVAADCLFYRVARTALAGERDAFFRHDLTRAVEVTAADYNCAKYRAPLAPYQDGESVAFLPDGRTFRCFYQDSVVRLFSPDGRLLRTLPYNPAAITMGIYSITLDADCRLWTADPALHRVAQLDSYSGQQLFALGGDLVGDLMMEPGEFDHPEEVISYGPDVFISDMGHQRLVRLNARTHELSTYRTFDQSVWEYRRVGGREVVRLQDGVYLL